MSCDWKIATEIKCPYFIIAKAERGARGFGITCEGIGTANSSMSRFNTSDQRLKHIEKYCQKWPNDCPLARAIDEKYEENGDENKKQHIGTCRNQ